MSASPADLEQADQLIEFATVADVNVDTLRDLIAQALSEAREQGRREASR